MCGNFPVSIERQVAGEKKQPSQMVTFCIGSLRIIPFACSAMFFI